MEQASRLTSKGQITIPVAVRRALSLREGDRVVFRVEGDRAIVARSPDLLALRGAISVPATRRRTAWADILRETRRARARRRR